MHSHRVLLTYDGVAHGLEVVRAAVLHHVLPHQVLQAADRRSSIYVQTERCYYITRIR